MKLEHRSWKVSENKLQRIQRNAMSWKLNLPEVLENQAAKELQEADN